MDFQELYELADKEVTLGLTDEKLFERAMLKQTTALMPGKYTAGFARMPF